MASGADEPAGQSIRPATPDDAGLFVRVYELASHGLAPYLWRQAAGPGGDAMALALERIAGRIAERDSSGTLVMEVDGRPAGGITTYEIGPDPVTIDGNLDPNIVPMVELENLAPGTLYINAVAVLPEYQSLGIGSRLIRRIEAIAPAPGTSLIVEDGNERAWRLYESLGYRFAAARPLKAVGWECDSSEWWLMTRPRD